MASVLAGKYRLDGVIGSGAFGTVYKAEHLDIGRAVAVKVLQIPEGMQASADQVQSRFLREAKILGRLEHPHAVQVLDFGEHEGYTFLVMELLRGRTLRQALKEDGAFGEPTIYHIAQQILAALARAHDLGLVHRDLKPSNVMLVPDLAGEEQVKLLDFGVATAFRDDSLADARNLSVTTKGMFIGTPQYAAPEQFMGDATAASDVYAVGLLLWEMVTGQPAVGSRVVALCAEAHLGEQKWRLPQSADVSPELARVIHRALDKRREHRYSDASAMLADVQFMTRASTAEIDEISLPATTPMSFENFTDRPGDLVAGKYRLGKLLGAGGFSRVLRATHVDMEREVAIKLLDLEGAVARSGGTTAADLKARFSREAKMSSQLQHPNTITVFDFGSDEQGRWYIAMELIEGTNLHAAIRKQGRFDPRRAATIARDCLRSLAEAHHRGFLHRDLKPGNIMVTKDFAGDEAVKVLDFGIATVVDVGIEQSPSFAPMKATQMGTFVGTPQYAAPEQFLGESLTPGTDIYMLGLVMWEMLTGRAAIETDVFGQCLKTHLAPTPWRFSESAGVPPGLAQIVYGALEKEPERRYKSAKEMADDLDQWLTGSRTTFSPSPSTQERWQPAMDYATSAIKKRVKAPTPTPDPPPPDESIELEPLLGSGDRLTFDPNLDEDFEPEFLKAAASEPAAEMRRGKRGGLASIPAFKEARIELDQTALSPQRKGRTAPASGSHDSVPVTARSQSFEKERPEIDWPKVAGGVGLILLVIVVFASVNQPEEQPKINVDDLTAVEPMHLEEFEESLREPEEEVLNRYSTEGILAAIEADGWTWRRAGESQALANVHEQGYRISRGKTSMEIRVVTTKAHSVAQKMFDQTNPPIGAVVFDNKLVRIFPPQGAQHPDVSEVARTLREYRRLVAEGVD